MPPEPVPADPGPGEDLAWLDRDPEREVWLDRARDHDEPPGEDEEYEDYAPLTPDELAEIREAAADELLAVKAATTGRRGPGQPGSARTFPGKSRRPTSPVSTKRPSSRSPIKLTMWGRRFSKNALRSARICSSCSISSDFAPLPALWGAASSNISRR